MIESVELIPILKTGNIFDEENKLVLWPPRRKAIKINADFNVKEYFFRVKAKKECEYIKIIINGFEILNLKFSLRNEYFEYRSDSLSTRSFLGFNLGLFELHLDIDFTKYPLATLNNKQGLLAGKKLEFMYESVAESAFFNFYISRFYRSNTLAKETTDTNTQHFWLRIALTNELHNEINKFIKGELSYITRIHTKSVVRKYNNKSVVSENDISWLIGNPNELSLSSSGIVSHSGLNFDINQMSQTIMVADYDTYENRLLLTCLYSIKTTLSDLSNEYRETNLFPHRSVERLIDNTDALISSLNSTFNLSPPFKTFPEFSNKFLDDVRYISTFSLISRWHTINNLTYGNEFRSPILGVTEIFEHFCFIKIIECLLNNGFAMDDLVRKDIDTSGVVRLIRSNEIISIYYEPSISKNPSFPLKNSKLNSSGQKPDIVIFYEGSDGTRCGVVDAKFSNADFIRSTLGREIYYKYGLFLHDQNNQPLDFVFAMYPSSGESCSVDYARDSNFINIVKPALGYFSIPFDVNSANEISEFIMPMICGENSA